MPIPTAEVVTTPLAGVLCGVQAGKTPIACVAQAEDATAESDSSRTWKLLHEAIAKASGRKRARSSPRKRQSAGAGAGSGGGSGSGGVSNGSRHGVGRGRSRGASGDEWGDSDADGSDLSRLEADTKRRRGGVSHSDWGSDGSETDTMEAPLFATRRAGPSAACCSWVPRAGDTVDTVWGDHSVFKAAAAVGGNIEVTHAWPPPQEEGESSSDSDGTDGAGMLSRDEAVQMEVVLHPRGDEAVLSLPTPSPLLDAAASACSGASTGADDSGKQGVSAAVVGGAVSSLDLDLASGQALCLAAPAASELRVRTVILRVARCSAAPRAALQRALGGHVVPWRLVVDVLEQATGMWRSVGVADLPAAVVEREVAFEWYPGSESRLHVCGVRVCAIPNPLVLHSLGLPEGVRGAQFRLVGAAFRLLPPEDEICNALCITDSFVDGLAFSPLSNLARAPTIPVHATTNSASSPAVVPGIQLGVGSAQVGAPSLPAVPVRPPARWRWRVDASGRLRVRVPQATPLCFVEVAVGHTGRDSDGGPPEVVMSMVPLAGNGSGSYTFARRQAKNGTIVAGRPGLPFYAARRHERFELVVQAVGGPVWVLGFRALVHAP